MTVPSATSCNLNAGSYSFSDVSIAGTVNLLGAVTMTVSDSFIVSATGSILGVGVGLAVGAVPSGCTLGGSTTGGVHGGIGGPASGSAVLGAACGSHEW